MATAKDVTQAKKTPPMLSLMAGGIAGSVEAAVTYPFEFAKTRVQLQNEKGPKNPFSVVTNVARKEGARALWRGASTMVVGSFLKDSIRFLTFDTIKSSFADPETHTLSPLRSLASGMAAGVIASTFAVTPTERLKTALIDDARNHKTQRFKGPMHAGLTIYKEKGIRGLWAGWTSTTLKQAGATAMRLGSYNVLKDYESAHGWQSSTALNFVNGAVAGTVTTLVTQPIDVVKTRAQSVKGAGVVEAVGEIWKNGGISGFWRGTTMRLGRTVISGGVLFMVNEKAVEVLRPILSPT